MKRSILLFLFLLISICLSGCDIQMTEEEFAAYRASCIHEYEVCSVVQYIKEDTNLYGGVIDTDLCYAFTYIDGNGTLREIDDFQHLEYGLTKVCIGDSDKYVVDTYGEEKRYLYLNKETLDSIRR